MMQFSVLIVSVVALLAGLFATAATTADNGRTFYDASGRVSGTASTSGSTTTYRDSAGRLTATATRLPDGRTEFRDAQGRLTGTTNK
jgi:YD repeat-containing protein